MAGSDENFEVRIGGTSLEVDTAVIGDNSTIEINFQLMHDTGITRESDHTRGLIGELANSKSITTQISIQDGNYLLIGNWKPTGDPRYEKNDLGHVVFVTASIQRFGGYGQVIETKCPSEKQ